MSTATQASPKKKSLDGQIKDNRETAKKFGFRIVKEIKIPICGAEAEAKHLQMITNLVIARKIEAAIFQNMDRSFREVLLGLQLISDWKKLIRVIINRQEIDWDNPDNKLMNTIELGFAEHRRGKLIQAAKKKEKYAEEQGRWYGGRPPIGYSLDKDTRTLTISEESQVIQQLFEEVSQFGRYAVHENAARILNLNEKKLIKIVRDPVYRGVNRYGKNEYPWPPYRIVSDELWEKAQLMSPPKPSRKRKKNPFDEVASYLEPNNLAIILIEKGMIRCPDCGSKVILNGSNILRKRIEVPEIKCINGHFNLLTECHEIDNLEPITICWECRERRKNRFRVVKAKTTVTGWRIRCLSCGWGTRTRDFPFGESKTDRENGGPGETSLDGF